MDPSSHIYHVAERFKSVQGEGLYAGTPMAFIRFIGCSVGKKICHACDTDFDKELNWRGGGAYTATQLLAWALPYQHICLTGGEPLDQNLAPLLNLASYYSQESMGLRPVFHLETSGTKLLVYPRHDMYVCVSPKPGYLEEVVMAADEIKVIVPGLGSGLGWPAVHDALRWADAGKTVFLQPRNDKFDLDMTSLRYVQDLIAEYPQFRLSLQLHKLLKVQ